MSLWKRLFGGPSDQQSQSDAELLAKLLVDGYRTTLDRMQSLGDASIRNFVSEYLMDARVAEDVCRAGLEKMALTTRDNKEHSIAWGYAMA